MNSKTMFLYIFLNFFKAIRISFVDNPVISLKESRIKFLLNLLPPPTWNIFSKLLNTSINAYPNFT